MDDVTAEMSRFGAWLGKDIHFSASPILISCLFVIAYGFVSWLRGK